MAITFTDYNTLSDGRKKYIENRAKKMDTDLAGYFAQQRHKQNKLKCQQQYNLESAFFDKMITYTGNDMAIPIYEEQIFGQQFMCYNNAKQYVKQYGGKVVYGWQMLPAESNAEATPYYQIGIAELHHHAVVEKDNRLICVTPYAQKSNFENVGLFGGDLNFTRYFWRDDRFNPKNRKDNLMYLPNTNAAQNYQNRCFDLKHLKLGVLGHLDPKNYPDRPSTLSALHNIKNNFLILKKEKTAQ